MKRDYLPSFTAVEDEATRSFVDFLKDALKHEHASDHPIAIEVRDERGPVLKVRLALEVQRPH